MKRDIVLDRHFAHPPERVWRALTEPAAIAQWLMANDFEPRLGHRFQFRSKPQGSWNGIVDCVVTELEAPRRLAYSWTGDGKTTTVTWTLSPEAGGTRLELEHRGFKGIGGFILATLILGPGWKGMLARRFEPALLGLDAPDAAPAPGCEHT